MKATSPTCSADVPQTPSPSAASAIASPATPRYYSVGAASGVLGVVFLMLGTALHPVPADGNDAAVAFGVYAEVSRSVWLAAHLLPWSGSPAWCSRWCCCPGQSQRPGRDDCGLG